MAVISGYDRACDFAKYAHRFFAEFRYRFNLRFIVKIILSSLPAAAWGVGLSSIALAALVVKPRRLLVSGHTC